MAVGGALRLGVAPLLAALISSVRGRGSRRDALEQPQILVAVAGEDLGGRRMVCAWDLARETNSYCCSEPKPEQGPSTGFEQPSPYMQCHYAMHLT